MGEPPIPLGHVGRKPEPERKFLLIERVRARMRASRYSRRTEEAYIDWIRRYVLFHNRRNPAEMGEPEIGEFVTDLAVVQKAGASTQNQAMHALLFMYRHVLKQPMVVAGDIVRARSGRRLPVVLSTREVRSILERMRGVPTFVRYAPSRGRLRHSNDSGAAWPLGCADHHDLYARAEQGRAWNDEPG